MSDFTKNVIAQNVVHKKCLSCLFRISLNSWSNRVSQNWLFCRQAELLFIVAGEYIIMEMSCWCIHSHSYSWSFYSCYWLNTSKKWVQWEAWSQVTLWTIPVLDTFWWYNWIPNFVIAVVIINIVALHILQSRDLFWSQVLIMLCIPPSINWTSGTIRNIIVKHQASINPKSLVRCNKRLICPVDRVFSSLCGPGAPIPDSSKNWHWLWIEIWHPYCLVVPEDTDWCVVHIESAVHQMHHC